MFVSTGEVDLLLHLLSNITHLPVTKEMVANSKLGKAVVAIGSHKICTEATNESTIREAIALFKEQWSASVKQQLKHVSITIVPLATTKRIFNAISRSPICCDCFL